MNKDSLLAYWTFENNGRDTSGRGYHLTTVGTPDYVNGKIGKCVDFERDSTEYMKHTALEIDTSRSYTLGAWAKREAGGVSCNLFGKTYYSGGDKGWSLYYRNSNERYRNRINATEAVWSATLTTALVFIIAWYDADVDSIYISIDDGIPVAAASGPPGIAEGEFTVGSRTEHDIFWDGWIDEAFIFKRLLTADERTWLYNSGTGRSWNEWAAPPPPMVTPWVFSAPVAAVCGAGIYTDTVLNYTGTAWLIDGIGAFEDAFPAGVGTGWSKFLSDETSYFGDTTEHYDGTYAQVIERKTALCEIASANDALIASGKHATILFWAKAASGTPTVRMQMGVNGTAGTYTDVVISTTWTQYCGSNMTASGGASLMLILITDNSLVMIDNVECRQED